jgi:hypothetical protein
LELLALKVGLDDGKPQSEIWSASTDGTSAFINDHARPIYRHILPRREKSSSPFHKVVMAADEYL